MTNQEIKEIAKFVAKNYHLQSRVDAAMKDLSSDDTERVMEEVDRIHGY